MSEAELVGDDMREVFGDYLDKRYDDVLAVAQDPEEQSFYVPYDDLRDHHSHVARELLEKPDMYGGFLEDALTDVEWDGDDHKLVPDGPFTDVTVRVHGLPSDSVYDVGQWNPNAVSDALVAVRGQVTRRNKRQLRDETTAFECTACGTVMQIPQEGELLQEPHECANCEGKSFNTVDAQSVLVNFQRIRLQALPEKVESTATEQIDVELTDDLVGSVEPGDRVIVTGTLRTERKRKGSAKKRTRDLYLEGSAVELLDAGAEDMDVEPFRDDVEDLSEKDDIFERWVDSIAPDHKGDRLIKKALALVLVGGVQKTLPDGTEKRGNSHILLIGDPGTGKSGLIRYVADLEPRSEYATGKGASQAGLTATAQKDDWGGGGWTLEAGTLVKAHGGMAAIDELDKMEAEDRGGLMECMSEQTVTISKAASGQLPARTTVVSAANPEYGTFDPHEDIGEQLDLDPVLLSRFDLWFVMRDDVDEDEDRDIAEHINVTTRAGQKNAADKDLDADEKEATEPEIDPEVLRAYISIAREHTPVLTDDAMEYVRENYVELRQSNGDDGPVPVTARNIEAVHRLAEASARIRLSDTVEEEDVERAIAVRDHCLETLGRDPETGELDAMRMATGNPNSQRERVRAIKAVVRSVASEVDDAEGAPKADVREKCVDGLDMDEDKFDHQFEKMAKEGMLYQPNNGEYKVS